MHPSVRPLVPLAALATWLVGCRAASPDPEPAPMPVVMAPAVVATATVPSDAPPPAPTAPDPFAPIAEWPSPSPARTAAGAPGPGYWQQRADYAIAVTLDTAAQSLRGRVTLRYTNNSPDTLRFVWLQLEQNLYAPGSEGSRLFGAGTRWAVRQDAPGGYTLGAVTVEGREAAATVDGTRMRVDLPAPLLPRGGVTTLAMDFAFRVPAYGSDRMARDGALYEIAQWYPRVAVYDDLRGWNAEPYLGQGEFYLEYGDIDYAITVPAGYVVAGSGVLQNPQDVLTPAQRTRLAIADRADTIVHVITADEATTAATRTVAGMRTWRFRAERVRDVAWAAAPDFAWDATSWHGVRCQALWQPARTQGAWALGAEQTCWAIRTYSQLLAPYPYPQATSVAGPVGGMEYPMFVMVHAGERGDPATVFGTLDHEQGHEWFPMVVGSNERRYAWMDEGLNTLVNAYSGERRIPGTHAWPALLASWREVVDEGLQAPLMTPPDRLALGALGAIAYRKPAAVLLTLRNHVLDPATFDMALREYVRRWAFRHPGPADFFRTVEQVSGRDLAWYWRGFWYGDDVLDIGIAAVVASGGTTSIALRQHTGIPFPVTLRVAYADGTTDDVRLPVEVWGRGPRHTLTVPTRSGVTGVRLWPGGFVPDWDPANDAWGDAPAADPPRPATAGGLAAPIPAPSPAPSPQP
jgi:hypothetical protein